MARKKRRTKRKPLREGQTDPRSIWDDEKRALVLRLRRLGLNQEETAQAAGTNIVSINNERRRNQQFAGDYDAARLFTKRRILHRLRREIVNEKGDWRAAAWLGERMFPDELGRRAPNSYSREQVVQFALDVADIFAQFVPPDKMNDAKTLLAHAAAALENRRAMAAANSG